MKHVCHEIGPLSAFSVGAIGRRVIDGSVSAGWVFPVLGPPIRHGVVEFSDGRIVSAGRQPGRVDLPMFALLPRLVNLHTHWELSSCEQPIAPGTALPEWIPEVVGHRFDRDGSGWLRGRDEAWSTGSAVCLDIAQSPAPSPRDGLIQRSFVECIGLSQDRAIDATQKAREFVSADADAGISPHAPYSVSPDLLAELVELAAAHSRPVTMHLAESPAERVLLERGAGPFVDMLRRFGVWDASLFGNRTISEVLEILCDSPRLILAHCNDLQREEWLALADCDASVAYCPRTHQFFGYDRHPVAEMLEDGVNVGLGTDSRASNPDLSLWNEVTFLREYRRDLSPARLIEMATIRGARAVALENQFGAIAEGFDADLLVVPLAKPDATDPYEALFG